MKIKRKNGKVIFSVGKRSWTTTKKLTNALLDKISAFLSQDYWPSKKGRKIKVKDIRKKL